MQYLTPGVQYVIRPLSELQFNTLRNSVLQGAFAASCQTLQALTLESKKFEEAHECLLALTEAAKAILEATPRNDTPLEGLREVQRALLFASGCGTFDMLAHSNHQGGAVDTEMLRAFVNTVATELQEPPVKMHLVPAAAQDRWRDWPSNAFYWKCHAAAKRMEKRGGHFASAIGAAFFHGDGQNAKRLVKAFIDVFEEYMA